MAELPFVYSWFERLKRFFPYYNSTTKLFNVAGSLDCTLAPCTNTVTPTNILTVPIPANSWGDGEKITVDVIASGATNLGNLNLDLSYGSDTLSGVNGGSNPAGTPARNRIELWRIGTSIYISNDNYSIGGSIGITSFPNMNSNSYDSGTYSGILTSVSFSTDKDIVITATWDTADAGNTVEFLAAKVTKV